MIFYLGFFDFCSFCFFVFDELSLLGFGCFLSNKKEYLIPKGDEVAEKGQDHRVDFYIEFKPIEHPLEPTDEDRPVKCPMHNSSVLNVSPSIFDSLCISFL